MLKATFSLMRSAIIANFYHERPKRSDMGENSLKLVLFTVHDELITIIIYMSFHIHKLIKLLLMQK
uniref:Uncharacterized protein n=1 Tax=Strigamia maritima TaxID=126957 RepID=T1IWG9_STRMM